MFMTINSRPTDSKQLMILKLLKLIKLRIKYNYFNDPPYIFSYLFI